MRVTSRISRPSRSARGKAIALFFLALALSGCQRRFYATHGTVRSNGGPLGYWNLAPDGCSLAPFDRLPVGTSNSIVEFMWQHGRPSLWTRYGVANRWGQAPSTLDIRRTPRGVAASFKLERNDIPIELNDSDCTELRLDSHPGPPVVPGGPPSLAGHLLMDCTVDGSHLTANVIFRGCVL